MQGASVSSGSSLSSPSGSFSFGTPYFYGEETRGGAAPVSPALSLFNAVARLDFGSGSAGDSLPGSPSPASSQSSSISAQARVPRLTRIQILSVVAAAGAAWIDARDADAQVAQVLAERDAARNQHDCCAQQLGEMSARFDAVQAELSVAKGTCSDLSAQLAHAQTCNSHLAGQVAALQGQLAAFHGSVGFHGGMQPGFPHFQSGPWYGAGAGAFRQPF